jgi:arylsulfatase A-like enzyme
MRFLARAALRGAAYGLAVAAVEMWLGGLKLMELRMPPLPASAATAAALEIALGAALGVVLAPVARLPGGRVWHVAAVSAAWTALARWVAPDPAKVFLWLTGPAAGTVLLLLGALAVRRWRRLPWLVGAAAVAAAIATPVAVHHVRTRGAAPPPPAGAARPGAPDVVVVVLDTVRAQSASAYGYRRPTTPTLERLAADGALFLDATAPSTWSLPSHASLFTGWYPSAHGAHGEHRLLGPAPPTLAETLGRAGYETRCFTANPHISDGFGLTRGFAWSDRAWLAGAGGRSFLFIYRVLDLLGLGLDDKGGGTVADNFERWTRARPPGGPPAFAFLNFLEAHFPYHQVPAPFLARFTDRSRRELRGVSLAVFGAQFGRALTPAEAAGAVAPSVDMYDAGILYSDHLLRRVVEALRAAGRLDRTILVVLSDHGEMLGEHGVFGHGAALYEPGVRVPLVVRYPPRVAGGGRVATPVSTLGVFATVLDLAEVAAPGPLHVGSLLPALAGRPAGAPVIVERFAVEEAGGPLAPLARVDRRYRSYRSGALKLVETSGGERLLFDLAADPGEERDLAASRPEDVARLADELATWVRALGLPALGAPVAAAGAPPPSMDDATRERLRALGYVE